MLDQVVFPSESMMVPFALGERTEELGRAVFLAVVTLEATLVGEGLLLACTDRTCEGSLMPILMPSRKELVKSFVCKLKMPYLSSEGCKNDLFEHCSHLHFNPRLPESVRFAVERNSTGIATAVWAWGETIESLL
jgi:hypothetical protein